MPWTEDLNRKAKEKYDRRRRYIEALVECDRVPDAEGVAIKLHSSLIERLHLVSVKIGWQRGSRRLAGALLKMALDDLESMNIENIEITARDLESGSR